MKFEKFPFKIEKQYRLSGYDYSKNGYYFVTICTRNKEKLFGDIHVGADPCVCALNKINVGTDPCVCSFDKNENKNIKFIPNNIGLMINKFWKKLPKKFSNIKLDVYQIMPDHLHGIIIVKNNFNKAQTHGSVPTFNSISKFGYVGLLGQIIRWFKSMTTNEYIKNVKQNNWPKFQKYLWQPRFHDRIIRNEKEYFAIRQYIKDNPKNLHLLHNFDSQKSQSNLEDI